MESTFLSAGAIIASLISLFVGLSIRNAVSQLQRDIAMYRRQDENEIHEWVENRFVRRPEGVLQNVR